jgi:hypothetical protein
MFISRQREFIAGQREFIAVLRGAAARAQRQPDAGVQARIKAFQEGLDGRPQSSDRLSCARQQ